MPDSATAVTVPVTSDFDSDLDGWTGNIIWSAVDGNPDGYAKLVQTVPAPDDIVAPAKFLGDWSALDGVGQIGFDHRIFDEGDNADEFYPYSVFIAGAGGEARWEGPTPTGPTPWLHFDVPLQSGSWNVESGTWSDLLDDVALLAVRIELVGNTTPGYDEAGVDNVTLTPEPSTLALTALGLLGLAFYGWRRRR